MRTAEKLDLLEQSKFYTVTKRDDGCYIIEINWDEKPLSDRNEGESVVAEIKKNGSVSYYVEGCYNSGLDWMEINITELQQMMHFVKLLQREE